MLGSDSRGVCVVGGVRGCFIAPFKDLIDEIVSCLCTWFLFYLFFRYDEWIKADKIVRPANKNVPKIKHRKKIKVRVHRVVTFQLEPGFWCREANHWLCSILTEQSGEGARQVGEAQWQRSPRPFIQLEPRPTLQMWPESGCLFQDGRGWGQRDSAVSSQVYRNYFYPQWPAR